MTSEREKPRSAEAILRCENCGHPYRRSEYRPDAGIILCTQCRMQLPHDTKESVAPEMRREVEPLTEDREPGFAEQLRSDLAALGEVTATAAIITVIGGGAGGVMLTTLGYAYRVFIMELGAWPSLLAVFSQNGAIIFGIGFVFGAFYYLGKEFEWL